MVDDDAGLIRSIGICGGGKMGLSLLRHISGFEYDVVFYARDCEKLKRIERSFLKGLKYAGQYSCKPNAKFTNNIADLSETDIVFEFVSEELNVKKEVLGELIACKKNANQILATGSSSLVPNRLDIKYGLNNVIGVHFFYPVQFIKPVEVIYGCDTNPKVLERVREFIRSIDREPISIPSEAGIYSVKMISRVQNEAFRIHRESNIGFLTIDDIVVESMSMAPFEMFDSVGIQVAFPCGKEIFRDPDEYPYYLELDSYLESKVRKGETGKVCGKGFFDYSSGKKAETDKWITNITTSTRNNIIERIKMIQINTCFKFLNNCWIDSIEADYIIREMNYAEAGPVELAYRQGLDNVLTLLKNYECKYGLLFRPPEILRYAQEMKVGRDEIDKQIRMFRIQGTEPCWNNYTNRTPG